MWNADARAVDVDKSGTQSGGSRGNLLSMIMDSGAEENVVSLAGDVWVNRL